MEVKRGRNRLTAWFRREHGQTMTEYAVVLGMISIGVVAAFTALSGGVSAAITNAIGVI
jgi:Flp pilus assembly pilin Flp